MTSSKRLNVEERWRVVHRIQMGTSQKKVAAEMKLNLSSVKRIWKKFKQTQDVKDRPRTGRKSATTRREDRMIVRMVKCNRRITSL